MANDIPSFQRYQQTFTAYIRDPINQPRPQDVVAKRMDVYKEIVFNNLFESVSACFPVARKVVGQRIWLKLIRGFFREYSADTPIFRKIPEEFLTYLSGLATPQESHVPPYLISLCHYEWVELLVTNINIDLTESALNHQVINQTADLLEYQPILIPAMQLLNYEYAVQKISPRNKPKEKINTQLLVYRNELFAIKFVELNPVTFKLITLLQQQNTTGKQALTLIADELKHMQPDVVIQFGLGVLETLYKQGVILGVATNTGDGKN